MVELKRWTGEAGSSTFCSPEQFCPKSKYNEICNNMHKDVLRRLISIGMSVCASGFLILLGRGFPS